MFRSRFFWRNFLSYVVVISLTTFVVSYLLTMRTQKIVESETRESLKFNLTFLISLVKTFDSLKDPKVHQHLLEIAKQSNSRITIIDQTGKVILETQVAGPVWMELDNHIARPEIKMAIEQGSGTAVRFSDSVKLPMIYIAKKIETEEGPIFIRLALPFSQLEDRLSEIRYALGVGSMFGMIVSLLIALVLARRVTEPIAAITNVAEAISRGNYGARLERLPRNELGTLGRAINRLAEAIQANISRREKVEKIRREFSSNASHELKTPLTSISGYVETLLEGAIHDQEVNVRFLKIIKSNIERMIALVTDLLRLSTIEANEGLVSLEAVNWQQIIHEVVNRQLINFQKKDIQFKIDQPQKIPLVRGSPRAMVHILDNLLQNAVNYTPNGGRIWVEVRVLEKHVDVSVTDTGIGISEKDQLRIFERFYRVDAARSRDEGGTGLGLAIVKHLVIQIHGTIRVESQLKKGSKFTVTLPIVKADTSAKLTNKEDNPLQLGDHYSILKS